MSRNSEALSDALTALLSADPFHSAMLMNMDIIENDKYPTAATDGWKKIWINPNFIKSMPPAEGAAVIAHEVGHAVRFHTIRMKRLLEQEGEIAPVLYNMAADFRINKDLHDMGYPFLQMSQRMGSMTVDEVEAALAMMGQADAGHDKGDGFCFDTQVSIHTDTDDIYRRFLAAVPPSAMAPQQGMGMGMGQGSGQSGGQGDQPGDGQGDQQGDGQGDQPGDGQGRGTSIMGGSDISLEEFENTLKEQGATPESAEQDITTSIVAAAKAAQERGIGNLPAHVQSIVDRFNKPSVDWRSHLRRFVSAIARDDWSFRRMHRRSTPPIINPSLYSERPGIIGIVIDTSGSVSDAELQQALTEVQSICRRVKPQEIIVLAVDTQVNNVVRYKPGQAITSFDAKGRGGTDMMPGFNWFKENNIKPECVICCTDGELFRWPSRADMRGVPLLWAICNPRMEERPDGCEYGHYVKIVVQD